MSSPRTYYVVLGVPRSESPSGIRSAFRHLALRYHPDRAGPQSTALFQEIVEAYRTLANPGKRAAYDDALDHVRGAPRPPRPRVTPAPAREVEPLIPYPHAPARFAPIERFEVDAFDPAWLRDQIRQRFSAPARSGAVDGLALEVRLDALTALRGGILRLDVPVFYPCRRCRGRADPGACPRCDDSGLVEQREPIDIVIPPRIADGMTARVPLRGLGLHDLELRLRVRIRPLP